MSKQSTKQLLLTVLASAALLAFGGCKSSQPKFIYMPDMVYSPAFKAQKPGSMRKRDVGS